MKENIEGQQQQQQTLQKSVIFRNRSRRKESEKECHQRPKANHTKDLERDDHPNKGPTSLQSLRGHGCTLHQKHQLLYKMGTFAQLVESINLPMLIPESSQKVLVSVQHKIYRMGTSWSSRTFFWYRNSLQFGSLLKENKEHNSVILKEIPDIQKRKRKFWWVIARFCSSTTESSHFFVHWDKWHDILL